MVESTTEGDSQLVRSSQGEGSYSGTPQHSSRRSWGSNQQPSGYLWDGAVLGKLLLQLLLQLLARAQAALRAEELGQLAEPRLVKVPGEVLHALLVGREKLLVRMGQNVVSLIMK